MEVPLIRSSASATPLRTSYSNQHDVQLSRYDGRLLLDRQSVPADDGFAEELDVRQTQRRPFNHYLVAIAYFLCTAAYAVALGLTGWRYGWGKHRLQWGIAVSAQTSLLLLALLLEIVLKHVHRRHRASGHLQVYRCTKGLVRYPFRIAALTTASLMLIGIWPDQHPLHVLQWALLVSIAAAQAFVTAVWAAVYSMRVWRHNHGEGWPDAETDLRHGWSAMDFAGRRRGEAGSAQQAELIRYLHRQRDSLSQEVLRLHVLLERRGGEPSAAPEVHAQSSDLEAARQSESRALAAAELLRRENRSTWAMVDEHKQELKTLQAAHDQQVEENARLRATLQEWSVANRKLEAALASLRAGSATAEFMTPVHGGKKRRSGSDGVVRSGVVPSAE